MDTLDEFELRAFEHLGCTHCAQGARSFLQAEIADGTMTLDQVADMEIVVHDDA